MGALAAKAAAAVGTLIAAGSPLPVLLLVGAAGLVWLGYERWSRRRD